jgi:hypothetical protein
MAKAAVRRRTPPAAQRFPLWIKAVRECFSPEEALAAAGSPVPGGLAAGKVSSGRNAAGIGGSGRGMSAAGGMVTGASGPVKTGSAEIASGTASGLSGFPAGIPAGGGPDNKSLKSSSKRVKRLPYFRSSSPWRYVLTKRTMTPVTAKRKATIMRKKSPSIA